MTTRRLRALKRCGGFLHTNQAWEQQHWRAPILEERHDPEQTVLTLPVASLLPDDAVRDLRERFEGAFDAQSAEARVILVAAQLEGFVTHERLRQALHGLHSRDLTVLLQGLVRQGLLEKEGEGRGTRYRLASFVDPSRRFPVVEQLNLPVNGLRALHNEPSSLHNEPSSLHNEPSSLHNEPSSLHNEPSSLPSQQHSDSSDMQSIAAPVAERLRAPRRLVEATIVALCRVRPLSLQELAGLLNRDAVNLSSRYLRPLLRRGKLELLYPEQPTHPEQKYVVPGDEG